MLSREQLKTVRKIQIRTSHLVSDLFAGQYQSVFKGRGMEFAEVRLYQPGDEIRTIDWNVTARGRGTDIAAALEHLDAVSTRRGVVFVISDFLDAGCRRALRVAARRHDLIA